MERRLKQFGEKTIADYRTSGMIKPKFAEAATIAMTVIRTALRNGLASSLYLKWVFKNIETSKPERLLPWSKSVSDWCRLFKHG